MHRFHVARLLYQEPAHCAPRRVRQFSFHARRCADLIPYVVDGVGCNPPALVPARPYAVFGLLLEVALLALPSKFAGLPKAADVD